MSVLFRASCKEIMMMVSITKNGNSYNNVAVISKLTAVVYTIVNVMVVVAIV